MAKVSTLIFKTNFIKPLLLLIFPLAGSGLDFGSEDPGSIPRLPSPRVGPLMARR